MIKATSFVRIDMFQVEENRLNLSLVDFLVAGVKLSKYGGKHH